MTNQIYVNTMKEGKGLFGIRNVTTIPKRQAVAILCSFAMARSHPEYSTQFEPHVLKRNKPQKNNKNYTDLQNMT